MYKLLIKADAETDATNAAFWYNLQREGLGEEFLLALEAKLNSIQRNPNQFNVVYRNVRRALTQRFPYGVFYIVEDRTIFILAIVHTSRNPEIWKNRK